MNTFIIAEAGSTWQYGKHPLRNAMRIMHDAKEAGAKAIKFQWCSDGSAMAKRRKFKGNPYKLLEWPKEWLPLMAANAEALGLEFMCTVFLPEDVEIVSPYVSRFKVASLEAADNILVDQCIRSKPLRDVIVSTGCCDEFDDPAFASSVYLDDQVQLMHCTVSYPSPLHALNLSVIGVRLKFTRYEKKIDGYSDHSANLLTGAVAVAAGASIIEVHCRLDRTPKDNPDYGHSHNPANLKKYIHNVRTAEVMLGEGRKQVQPCEKALMKHRVRG